MAAAGKKNRLCALGPDVRDLNSLRDRWMQPRPKILSRVQGRRATRAVASSVFPFCHTLRIRRGLLRLEQLPELEVLESLRPSPFLSHNIVVLLDVCLEACFAEVSGYFDTGNWCAVARKRDVRQLTSPDSSAFRQPE